MYPGLQTTLVQFLKTNDVVVKTLIIEYGMYANIPAFAKATHIVFSKNTCELDIVLTIEQLTFWPLTFRPVSVAQLDAPSDWRPGGRGFNPRRGRQHSFVEVDHEIFSTVILSLQIQ